MMSDIYKFDVIVVGAGVIGIAIAMTCAKKKKSVLLIEKNSGFGEEISSRNSEVIHAGIYYPKDSLKAKFCRDGMERLYKYCTKKKIPIKKTGKLIVQTNPKDQNKLLEILDTGKNNGCNELRLLNAKEINKIEPEVTAENANNAEEAAKQFIEYTQNLLDKRRKHPEDDMITRLSQVSEDNNYLTDDQIICTVILLLNAGHEATVNTLGNGLHALLTLDQSFDEIKKEAEDINDIVEELIRYDSPLQFFQRYALEDVEIGGHNISKGSKVAILLGSANRDPRVFENPDQINFKPEMKDHSSWGGGIHFCIGTHLARLELGVSFNHILEKQFSLIEEPSRTGAFGIRGFKNLLVSA